MDPAADDRLAALMLLALGFLFLALCAGWWWFRLRDPDATDERARDTTLPPELTPALASIVLGHGFNPYAFASAVLDRAAHGQVRFDTSLHGPTGRPALRIVGARPRGHDGRRSPATYADPTWAPGATDPAGSMAESAFAADLDQVLAECGGLIPATDLWRLAPARRRLGRALETELVALGLLRYPRLRHRLLAIPACIVMIGGVLAWSSTGLPVIVGNACLVAGMLVGVPLALPGWVPPPLTADGVRTGVVLERIATRVRSTMRLEPDPQSAAAALHDEGLELLGTPDRLVVWAVALGLRDELRTLLWRPTLQDPDTAATAGSAAWWRALGDLLIFEALVTYLSQVVQNTWPTGSGRIGGDHPLIGGYFGEPGDGGGY